MAEIEEKDRDEIDAFFRATVLDLQYRQTLAHKYGLPNLAQTLNKAMNEVGWAHAKWAEYVRIVSAPESQP